MRASRSRRATQLTIDIVGVGPVVGTVRWAQASKFGVQFTEQFDLTRLAPRQEVTRSVGMRSSGTSPMRDRRLRRVSVRPRTGIQRR